MSRLIGRDEEERTLAKLVAAASRGTPRAALVEGEAGMGKSELVALACARARRSGFTVLAATADEVERSQLGVVLAALEGAVSDMGSVATDWGAARLRPDDDLGTRLHEAALERLEALAVMGPVVLAIDDAHWADDDSIRYIRTACRRLAGLPFLVVVAARPAPRSDVLSATFRALENEGGVRLALEPLSPDAVRQLARRVIGTEAQPAALARLLGTGGNPFLVVELARSIAGGQLTAGAELPKGVRDAVLQKFEALTAECAEETQAASVLGTRFDVATLARMRHASVPQMLSALAPAIRTGLLRDRTGRLGFAHDLVHQAIYESVPLGLRRALHAAAAEAVAAEGGAPAAIAVHTGRSASAPNKRTYQVLTEAASRATNLAEYAELLELAVSSAPDRASADTALVSLVNVLPRLDRANEIEALVQPLLAGTASSELKHRARFALAQSLAALGRARDANRSFWEIVAAEDTPLDLRIAAKAALAHSYAWNRQFDRAAALAAEVVAASEEAALCGRPELLVEGARARLALSTVPRALGRSAEAAVIARQALEMNNRSNAPGRHDVEAALASQLGQALCDADSSEEAVVVLTRALRTAEHRGLVVSAAGNHSALAVELYRQGHLAEAAVSAEASFNLAPESASRAFVAAGVLARVALHRGDPTGAVGLVDQSLKTAERHGPEAGLQWLLWAGALTNRTDVSDAWAFLELIGYPSAYRVVAPDLARLAVAQNKRDIARRISAHASAAPSEGAPNSLRVAALRCTGIVEGDLGALEEAVAGAEPGRPLERAGAMEDAAGAHIARGDRDRARDLLASAAHLLEHAGATADVGRLESEMQKLGRRRSKEQRQTRATSGWESLTPAELQVVALLSEGLTNREIGDRLFVARSTVHTHLLHVFAKLGCGSRAQVAALAVKRAASSAPC